MTSSEIFALWRPYGSNSSGVNPIRSAIVSIGRSSASCAISRLDFICLLPLVTDGSRRQLRHQLVRVEPLELEGLDQLRSLTCGGQLRQRLADDRRRLEPVRPPPRAHVEAFDLGLAEDGRVVGAEVAQSCPAAQDPRALQLREQLQRMARHLL